MKIDYVIKELETIVSSSSSKIEHTISDISQFEANIYNKYMSNELGAYLDIFKQRRNLVGKEIYLRDECDGTFEDGLSVLTEETLDRYIFWHINYLFEYYKDLALSRLDIGCSTNILRNAVIQIELVAMRDISKLFGDIKEAIK